MSMVFFVHEMILIHARGGRSALGLINGTSALCSVAATCCEILKMFLLNISL